MKNKGKPPVKGGMHLGHVGQGGSGIRAKTKQKARTGVTESVSDVSKQHRCVPANRPSRAPCFSPGSWGSPGWRLSVSSKTRPVIHSQVGGQTRAPVPPVRADNCCTAHGLCCTWTNPWSRQETDRRGHAVQVLSARKGCSQGWLLG